MRTETTTRTLYKFDELSDDAKEKSRNWWRNLEASDCDLSCTIDDAKTIAELFGLDIEEVYYSGFSCQGDGACFVGEYAYKKGAVKAVKDYAPQDTELHSIVEELQKIQRRNFYRLTATTNHSGLYYHSGCMCCTVYDQRDGDPASAETDDDVTQLLREFADWIYQRLEKEYDWRMSDENVDESIVCNEYEFTEDGAPA
jgi:hypothetical protein